MITMQPNQEQDRPAGFPVARVERWLAPVARFLRVESAGGIVLLTCTALALVLANSPLAESFAALWKTKVQLTIGTFTLTDTLGHLVINDGLMVIFFFVVGLEIKREFLSGELRDPRNALLPVFGAAGGMIVPAVLYLALQWGQSGQGGWAIPMATDIAFVVGVLALFGPRTPLGLKVLLLSLAIVDDLGSVLVIACVFTDQIVGAWLAAAVGGLVLTHVLNRVGVRRVGIYVVVGVLIWLAVLESGVHPTVAGVLLGFLTPARPWLGRKTFTYVAGELWNRLRGDDSQGDARHVDLEQLEFTAREATGPLHRLETALHPWVAFVIMPLFALANAGVALEGDGLRNPVALAVATGLVIGKPVGIVLFCLASVRLGFARLPDGLSWPLLIGGACLAGIGFTMSLFLNGLVFSEFPAEEVAGKIGTLVGSLISAGLGSIILVLALRRENGSDKAGRLAPRVLLVG
jgi:NhaA family Na+:H+ antiporter